MGLQALNDRVLVKLVEPEKATPGGILLPQGDKTDQQKIGDVVSVGNGARKDGSIRPIGVSVGDRVLFGKYKGNEVVVDGDTLYAVPEDDILAVIEPEAA